MKVSCNINKHNMNTNLYYLLRNLPENMLYYKEYPLRHPLAIYNISTNRVQDAISRFIISLHDLDSDTMDKDEKEVETLRNVLARLSKDSQETNDIKNRMKYLAEEMNKVNENAIDNYVDFLDSLIAFIDDTYHIIKTLFPSKSVEKSIIFADKWIKKADYSLYTSYKTQVNKYRDNLAPIVNKIKHNHARMRLISFKTNLGNSFGYFIESIDYNSVIIPDPEIHKTFRGMHTGISFNRDLKFNVAGFFYICEILQQTLYDFIKNKYGISIPLRNESGADNNDIKAEKLADQLVAISDLYFPDEYQKFESKIILENNFLSISYPNQPTMRSFLQGRVQVHFGGDGVTKSFQMPYFMPRP